MNLAFVINANMFQVAYLMADISNVDLREIKDLYESLESLSCKTHLPRGVQVY